MTKTHTTSFYIKTIFIQLHNAKLILMPGKIYTSPMLNCSSCRFGLLHRSRDISDIMQKLIQQLGVVSIPEYF